VGSSLWQRTHISAWLEGHDDSLAFGSGSLGSCLKPDPSYHNGIHPQSIYPNFPPNEFRKLLIREAEPILLSWGYFYSKTPVLKINYRLMRVFTDTIIVPNALHMPILIITTVP
jgi:hypothetical protein